MQKFRHDRTWAILFTGEELDRHDAMIRADAYQQGRADKEKELQGISDLGRMYSEIRADERAKVIDEILNLPKHKHYDMYGAVMYQSVEVELIKQLKEQINVDNTSN